MLLPAWWRWAPADRFQAAFPVGFSASGQALLGEKDRMGPLAGSEPIPAWFSGLVWRGLVENGCSV